MAIDDEEWVYDDPAVPSDAYVHRRLNDKQHLVFDDEMGRFVISIAAYRYVDADGLSVYVSSEMEKNRIVDDTLFEYCSYGLARIQVSIIRSPEPGAPTDPVAAQISGGVILREAESFPEDERVRKSHGLVRIHVRPHGKPFWPLFRHKLIQGSEYRASVHDSWIAAGAV